MMSLLFILWLLSNMEHGGEESVSGGAEKRVTYWTGKWISKNAPKKSKYGNHNWRTTLKDEIQKGR